MGRDRPELVQKPVPELFLSAAGAAELLVAIIGKGADCRIRAGGTSMHPFIKHGDIITVAALAGPVRIGEILAVRNPRNEKLLVHRTLAICPGAVRTKGDNCIGSDGWICDDRVLGRVVRCERGGRRIRLGLGPERVLIALLGRHMRVSVLARLTLPFRRLPGADPADG